MKKAILRRPVPSRAARLRSEILQLEARYDSGAMPKSIYMVLKRMRTELAKADAEKK